MGRETYYRTQKGVYEFWTDIYFEDRKSSEYYTKYQNGLLITRVKNNLCIFYYTKEILTINL